MWADPFESVGDVLGEETAAESLRNAVVDLDGLLKSGVLLHEENGAEVLILQEGSVFRGLDDGRLDKVTSSVQSLTAVQHLSALSLDSLQRRVVDFERSCVVKRTAECGRVKGVSDLD